jgi:hypothetical protein
MIITQEPTQPLAALHRPPEADVPILRQQQNIALALVIALSMVVIDIFIEGPSQRTDRQICSSICSSCLMSFMRNGLCTGEKNKKGSEPGRRSPEVEQCAKVLGLAH